MRVKDLIEELKYCNKEDLIVIKSDKIHDFAGGSSYVDISHIIYGIDYDSGKVFIVKK